LEGKQTEKHLVARGSKKKKLGGKRNQEEGTNQGQHKTDRAGGGL